MKGFHVWYAPLSDVIYAGTDRSRHEVTSECVHAVMCKLFPDDDDQVRSVASFHSPSGKWLRLSCEWVDEEDKADATS